MKTFGILLYNLRKEKNMTQAQLAEKLNLTDKAISRWENDESYPEVEKLILLSKIFNVTVDELLNGELIEKKVNSSNTLGVKKVVPKEVPPMTNKQLLGIFIGIILCILGVFATPFLNFDEVLEVTGLFVPIGLGVVMFIVVGLHKTVLDTEFSEVDKVKVKPSIFMIAFGVFSFILSPISFALFNADMTLGIALFVVFLIIGLGLVIFGGNTWYKYSKKYTDYNASDYYDMNHETTLQGKIQGVLWILIPGIYIIMGLMFNTWGSLWILFPIGGFLSAIIGVIFSSTKKNDQHSGNN